MPAPSRPDRYRRQRGATLLSVLLLMVAMSTVGLLAMRTTAREVVQSGHLIARERALTVAQAASAMAGAKLAAAYTLSGGSPGTAGSSAAIDSALAGQGNPGCTACGDCIPGQNYGGSPTETGQRNHLLASGAAVDCGGRPCMRQGAVVHFTSADDTNGPFPWCGVPFRDIVPSGDPEAIVSVWVRNNASDALAGSSGSGSWVVDSDARLTVTATATVRGTTATVEEEILLGVGTATAAWSAPTADAGYGAGHNNDNTTGTRCSARSVSAD